MARYFLKKQNMFLFLVGGFVLLIITLVLLPLPKLMLMKMKYGKSVSYYYYPLIGRFKQLIEDLHHHNDMLYSRKRAYQQHPGLKIQLSNQLFSGITYTVFDPDLLKFIFQNHELYEKLPIFLFSDLWFDQALFGVKGKQWKSQRRLLGNHFTYDFLKQRVPLIKDVCNEVFKEYLKEDEPVKIVQVFSVIAGEVITRSFFSHDMSNIELNGKKLINEIVELITQLIALENRFNVFQMIRRMLYGVQYSKTPKCLLTKKEKNLIQRLMGLRKLVEQTIEERKKKSDSYNDFLTTYIEEMKKNPEVQVEEIIHQYICLLFAGVDTTSTLSGNSVWILSQMQDIQKNVYEKVKEEYQSFDKIQSHQLNDVAYLNAFINEGLRMYPPILQILPRKVKQTHKLGEFDIPKNAIVVPSFGANLYDEKQFPDPFTFKVERWLDESKQAQHNPFAFVPFSSGPRNCIGQHLSLMEVKLMLSYMLLNYEILPADSNTNVWTIKFLYCPQRPDYIRLKKRT